ncbi:DUF1329 domain-containing protein [Azoarcus sp. L1K30]|uniref:DUF1329 domain-containing protein n=1 Tax=Azoarcus sp. L1K30 TaxID=2820277 RepID=UPI001B840F7F|nr:DUF1329 domain-containing protein [Azoarcus sp. L1K30]MBR0565625.1 DUF1329 domain-containing protein [Azoarcus sp. L1K30]
MTIQNKMFALTIAMGLAATSACAAVSADEAAKLGQSLTPLGGDKAANADGSIPAWTGKAPAASAEKVGDLPKVLFPGEKPVVSINAKNMAQYKDKLTEGTMALMTRYPDSFRIDVYPTHRTAVAPKYVYDNTLRNATQCKLVADGKSLEGCYGGIPFPIPKTGVEVIWNHLLRVEPQSEDLGARNVVGTADGTHTLATRIDESFQYPYYFKDGSAESWNGKYWIQRFNTTAPPFKQGESLVIHDSVDADTPRQAWQYLVGQRRVRRAPTVAYDTPDFVASGANYFDEVMGFMGHPDRFEWKLVGKREMYIPYNANQAVTVSAEEAFSKFHLNPDTVRWELHRVWQVEATVAAGKRHAVPKRTFYFDEDTWLLVLMDGYDAEGKLWRTSQVTPFFMPTVPAVLIKPVTIFNLDAKTFSSVQSLNGEYIKSVERKPETFFTGDAVAAEASR